MNRINFVILSLVLLISLPCVAQDCDTDHPHCDPISSIVHGKVHDYLGFWIDSDNKVFWDRAYQPSDKTVLVKHWDRLQKLKTWALTIKGPEKQQYMAWIEFYEDGVREAMGEWESHKLLKHQQECDAAEKKARATLKIATPPKEPTK